MSIVDALEKIRKIKEHFGILLSPRVFFGGQKPLKNRFHAYFFYW